MSRKDELETLKLQKLVMLGDNVHFQVRTKKITDASLCSISEELIAIDKELHDCLGFAVPEQGDGICPSCQTVIREGSKFCGNCGTNIEDYYNESTIHCLKCDSIIGIDNNYCPVCGSKKGE